MSLLSNLEGIFLSPASPLPASPLATSTERAASESPPIGQPSVPAWLPPSSVGACSHGRDYVARPSGMAAVVFGRPGQVVYTAAALAHQLRNCAKTPTAAVLAWGAELPTGGGRATSGARRISDRLQELGVPAKPCGRLVGVALGCDADQAAWVAEKVWDNAPEIPCVLAVGGPRPVAFDRHLSRHCLAVLITAPGEPVAVTALATAELASKVAKVATVEPLRAAARMLALTGMGPGAPLRELAVQAVSAA